MQRRLKIDMYGEIDLDVYVHLFSYIDLYAIFYRWIDTYMCIDIRIHLNFFKNGNKGILQALYIGNIKKR